MLQSPDSAVVQSVLVGGNEGDAFDDLTTLGWPANKPLNINSPIAKLEVRSGWVVDALNITYRLSNGQTFPIDHGAQSGGTSSSIDISEDEVITDVVGKAGPHSYYKKSLVEQISFVILNKKTAKVRIVGPYGNGDNADQGALFHASGPIAIAGFQTNGAQTGLSGLSFITPQAWQ